MADRDLVLGVLAAQAGFVSPAQVMTAASARMLAGDGRSLLDHLVDAGALTPERRELVVALADEAIAANGGNPDRVLQTLHDGTALSHTLGASLGGNGAFEPAASFETDALPVEREGQYARLDELGRGGQSIVWRALDRYLGREVALKELTAPNAREAPAGSAGRTRFLREARLTAGLDHPGIATVLELARRPDGTLYAAQKLVRGRTLRAALAQCRTLGERLQLLPHLVDAAQAMAYAHARGVVHRDLKPSNVMLGPYGETVVVDWGLAKRRGEAEPAPEAAGASSTPDLTQAGVALGTPSYMSPEQARGELDAIDERSDVFSLGAMLYELLTGRPPFEGGDTAQVIEAVRSGRLTPVQVLCPAAPPELAAVAERALRTEPAGRYPDAGAFASELLVYRTGGRVEAYAYGALELFRKFVKRNRGLSAAIAASLLILIAGVVAVVLQLRHARVNLASALIERARRAEDISDWARAAAYYAASRQENDTAAARWGIALARERIPDRGTSLGGPLGAFADVDVLPDGTVVALETRNASVRQYDVATGRTLWTAEMESPIRGAQFSSGTVRLLFGHLVRVLDEQTGQARFTSDWDAERLCKNGPASRRARIERRGVLHLEGAQAPAIAVGITNPCAISPQEDRLAVRDQSGVVRLWDLDAGRELMTRPAPDTQEIAFTAHGVALVRSGALQLFGGPDGDFSVELPGRSASGFAMSMQGRGLAVSPDGHRAVVDVPALNRADVVDLRDPAVFASVSRPPGDPNYVFSPDGSRLYAAGLAGGRTLIFWNLRRPASAASGSGTSRIYLRAARERFLLFESRHWVELRAGDGTLLRRMTDPEVIAANLSGDGSTLAFFHARELVISRAEDGREVARLPCEQCRLFELSDDGSRVVGLNGERRRVWDVHGPSLVRDEPVGGGSGTSPSQLSSSGERLGWLEGDGYVLQEVSSGARTRLALPEPGDTARLSWDDTRVAIAWPGAVGVWTVPDLQRVWIAPNPSSVGVGLSWSADGSMVNVALEGSGAMLLDARTGETVARIVESRSGGGASQVNVLPTLRYRLTRDAHSWALAPLPGPETGTPAEGLRRALAEGGFQLRGVELEVVSP